MDLPTLPEHRPLKLPPAAHHHVGFDELVELIVPPAELPKGRPRVQLRKMSLPVTFASKPAECDLDDPSFIPNRPRRLSLRLPSFSRTPTIPIPGPGSPTAVDGPGGLKSCLVGGGNASSVRSATAGGPSSPHGIAIPGRLSHHGRTHSLGPASTGSACSFSALLSTSPPTVSGSSPSEPSSGSVLSSSVPTTSSLPVLHLPRTRRRSSISSVGRPPSLPPSPGSPGSSAGMADSLLLPLRNCCLACERTTELALLGRCVERFSPGARKKHAEDLKERAADEAMQDRWARGAIRVDEVAKKREGRETGLRETDPPAEEEEDAANAAAGGGGSDPPSGALAVVDRALVDAARSRLPTVDEPGSLLETPLSTPATDETSASTAATSSSLLQTPPLSPSTASSPSLVEGIRSLPTSPAATASISGPFPQSPQRSYSHQPSSATANTPVTGAPGQQAGKRKLWGMSLGTLPAFANPFIHRSDADHSVANVAGGHGRLM